MANDPAFEEEYGSESDYSDEDSDFSDEEDEASSEVASESDEDGVSWEEMEKRALEDDKRAAMRR